jgi:hypothetical protein
MTNMFAKVTETKKVIKSMTKDKSHGIYVGKNASEAKH